MNAGEAAQTQCLALKGDTPLNFTWTFHGDVTDFPTGVVTTSAGQRGSVLIIDSVTTIHTGMYTCTVHNQVASVSYSAVLSVTGTTDTVQHPVLLSPFSPFHTLRVSFDFFIPKSNLVMQLLQKLFHSHSAISTKGNPVRCCVSYPKAMIPSGWNGITVPKNCRQSDKISLSFRPDLEPLFSSSIH